MEVRRTDGGNVSALASYVIPAWGRWLALAGIFAAVFLLGQLHGERVAGQVHLDYIQQQATQTVAIVKRQVEVVTKVETKYRDRIEKVYVQGEAIEKAVEDVVTPADSGRCVIGAGFVRIYDAAWTGGAAPVAAESDREPTGVSLAELAAVDAHNAASCLAWREQALGLREFYERSAAAIQGDASK